VLVVRDRIVASAFNQPIGAVDPTAHAEVLVLREAAKTLGNYRLTDATVYVTLEPCLMCVGALVHARVREVIYGAAEPKSGALVSTIHALESPGLNHRFAVTAGVLEDECRSLIQRFFRDSARRTGAAGEADQTVYNKGALNVEAGLQTRLHTTRRGPEVVVTSQRLVA
jgi:tRNA(adenine34) deaminase